jgi:copper homeostasis protein
MLLEVCVDDVAGLSAAISGGADRIELCSALSLGGLTPSAGLMREAAARDIPCYAMIRPAAGGFCYSREYIRILRGDIDSAQEAGLAGVVLGASLPDGRLDRKTLEKLVAQADGLGLTLHRAFDLVPDWEEAIEIAVDLGFERILTSGGRNSAIEGVDELEALIGFADGRISIMPGSGINPQSVAALLPRLKIEEIHASCSLADAQSDQRMVSLGFSPPSSRRTDEAMVRRLKSIVA